jgi:hypothetical protein
VLEVVVVVMEVVVMVEVAEGGGNGRGQRGRTHQPGACLLILCLKKAHRTAGQIHPRGMLVSVGAGEVEDG